MSDLIIPPILHQTWHTKTFHPEWKKQFDFMREKNPHIMFKLYDDDDCREFIRKHFDKHVLWAFDALNTGAYKADLFRYCVLYIEGGIYMDIKLVSKELDYFRKKETIIVKDRTSCHFEHCGWYPDYCSNIITPERNIYPGVWQAILTSKPKDPIFKQLILHSIINVVNMHRGVNALLCTGPGAFYEALIKCNKTHLYNDSKLYVKHITDWSLNITATQVIDGDKTVAIEIPNYRKYSNYGRKNNNKYLSSNFHYGLSWTTFFLFKYPALTINKMQVLGICDAISFCKTQFNGFLSVKIYNDITSDNTIICTKNLSETVRFKITNKDNNELMPLFPSSKYKTSGMFNMSNIGNNTLVWHAFTPDNENITIFTRDNILDKSAWRIISGHCCLFYKDDQLYSIMQWWPSIEIAKIDLSKTINSGLFIQPLLSIYNQANISCEYTENISFSQSVFLNNDELLFLVSRQPSSIFIPSRDWIWRKELHSHHVRLLTSHQFIKINLKTNTIDASTTFSLGNSFYEHCCEMSNNYDGSINLVYNIFRDDARFETRQGNFNLNHITWISDEILNN